ncbi:cell division protein FtsQ/DivIB [Candidatus Sumerlaeota bacterium]|nr:cell division protein FtsQ/DivIB [Candidatus Sumerlaeota bacterium]
MANPFRRKPKYRPPVPHDRIGRRIARFFGRFFLALLVLAGLAALGWLGWLFHGFLFRSDFFALKDIEIDGADPRVEYRIRNALCREALHTGNVLRLDSKKIQEAAESISKVKSVRVRKRYPGRIRISVEQRYAVALVLSDPLLAVDSEGVVIEELLTRHSQASEFPYLTGFQVGRPRLGERLKSESLTTGLTLISYLRDRSPALLSKVSEVHFDEEKGLTLVLKGGTEVRFGRDDPLSAMIRFETFAQEMGPLEQYRYIDLRFGESVSSMPKQRPAQEAGRP